MNPLVRKPTPEWRLRAALAPLLVCLAAPALAGREQSKSPLPRDSANWTRVDSDNFMVLTDAGGREATAAALELERMRAAVLGLTHLKTQGGQRLPVLLFASARSFEPLRDVFVPFQDNERVGGFFIPSRDGGIIMAVHDDSPGNRSQRRRVLYHELTHYFLSQTFSSLPLWLNEGLAEFYSTFEASDSEVSLGRPLIPSLQVLRSGGIIPFSAFLATTQAELHEVDSRWRDLYYPQSWVLVHYLLMGEGRQGQLGNFTSLLREGTPASEAFSAAFGTTPAAMEVDLQRYVNRGTLSFRKVSAGDLPVPVPSPPRELSRSDLLLHWGRVLALAGPGHSTSAELAVKEALRLAPASSGAYSLLGELAERQGDAGRAREYFERALALDEGNPDAHLLLAGFLLRGLSREDFSASAADKETLARARQLAARAVQLSAASPTACASLAKAFLLGDDSVALPLDTLEACLATRPQDQQVTYNLALLLARGGHADRAVDVARTRLLPTNTHLAEAVQRTVVSAYQAAAERNLRDGDPAKAREILEQAVAATDEREIRRMLVDRIREIDVYAKAKADVQLYNEAVALLNAGEPREALQTLDRLLVDVRDPQLRDRASLLRERVRTSLETRRQSRK
ncbi:MAG: tetratricopeptide repeat protein [Acidobacteriota bacterium]